MIASYDCLTLTPLMCTATSSDKFTKQSLQYRSLATSVNNVRQKHLLTFERAIRELKTNHSLRFMQVKKHMLWSKKCVNSRPF